jgi:sec-independent protein translocase protein TatA
MGLLEPWHIIIIVFMLLLMFGGKKIPELMRGMGKGMKEFKDAQNGDNSAPPANTTTNTNTVPPGTDEKPRV